MSATTQIELNDLADVTPATANASTKTSAELDQDARARLNAIAADDDRRPVEAFDSYPDGGKQAWLQVFCCFALFFTTLGGTYSWGVLQDALYEAGAAPTATLSWIGSTLATHQAIWAVPIIRLAGAYGPKRVAVFGSLCAGLGPIIAGSCSRSIPGLVITEGIMFGMGQALVFHSGATLPSNYFLRRRNLATGLTYAGAGVGGAVFAPITSALIKAFGIPWTFRALGFIFLAINLPAAWLLKSRLPRVPLRRREGKEKTKIIDLGLFKDSRFVVLLVGGAIGVFPLFVPAFFIPLFGTSIGLTPSAASYLLAGWNLASACGRIGFGLGADAMFGSVNSLVLCLWLVAVSTLAIWPVADSIGPLAVFAVVNGFCAGGFFSLFPGVISTLFGSKKLRVVFSMIISSWTPGYFLGAPIAGYLLEAFGGPGKGIDAFRPAILYAGGLSLVSAALVTAVRLKETREWRKI